ncbi:hypothetical protein ID866_10100 [Astraeus odoratus]|nr:hypothetical protein ID866_10100 [Astraeus odoratus]
MQSSRVMINSGVLPSPRLDQLAASHPFIQQVHRCRISFLESILEVCSHSASQSIYTADWDSLEKDSLSNGAKNFTMLGSGSPVSSTGIKVLLKQETQSVAVRARQRRALNIWDDSRAESGHGEWEIAHVGGGLSTGTLHQTKIVKPQIWRYSDMFVPVIDIPQSKEESSEDREERIGGLLEWVAVYEPPMPSTVGNLTHLRWRGLMDSAFVQSVIAAATSLTTTGSTDDASFISVIMHSNPIAPVSYIPPSSIGSAMEETPPRVPRLDAEDTLCLVLANNTWMLGQSIGRWDARWG